VPDPGHNRYEEYSKDQLEWHLRTFPRHADREIVLRYLLEFQKKEREQQAENDKLKQDSIAERRHTENKRIAIAGIVVAAIVGLVAAWWNHNRPQPQNASTPQTQTPLVLQMPLQPILLTTASPTPTPASSPHSTSKPVLLGLQPSKLLQVQTPTPTPAATPWQLPLEIPSPTPTATATL
jgi:type IV secretory pathway VirB10-like protein